MSLSQQMAHSPGEAGIAKVASPAIQTPSAVLSIGALSEQVRLTRRTLRHYEDCGLLQPDRSQGQARLYSATDVEVVETISALRRLGFTIEEIKAMQVTRAGGRICATFCREVEARTEAMRQAMDVVERALGTEQG